MALPTKRFFNFDVVKDGSNFKIGGSLIGSYDVFDNQDNGGSGDTDSNTQLGDVSDDVFTSKSVSSSGELTSTYIGKTTNGFIAKRATYYLYTTNSSYAVGDTVSNFRADNPSDPTTFQPVCFMTGTRIRTARGGVPVEELAVSDLAVTASGEERPIRWIGHRGIRCQGRLDCLPVRIAAHAFGEGRPARDLLVSPAHAVAVDVLGEVLIPACRLINGTTITQEDVEEVTYWHVELDSHDILLAEGLPAESYLDCGNRRFFANADVTDLAAGPDARPEGDLPFCRPFHEAGPLVDLVRARLEERAEMLGWCKREDTFAGLHLVADGRTIHPEVDGLTARFVLPAGTGDVRLVSETSVPADVVPDSTDARRLGLPLAGLSLDDGLTGARTIALDDPRLGEGFYAFDGGVRWTDGDARLPASLWDGCRGTMFLRLTLATPALPRWVAPQAGNETRDEVRRNA